MTVAAVCSCGGSSPRVRGTHQRVAALGEQVRFIPACAGNSSARAAWAGVEPVHPRVCGELAIHRHPSERCLRFIPACAGNSSPGHRLTSKQPGSSPRVRGTRRTQGGRSCCRRFIPACAGNSSLRAGLPTAPAVHPRVCGELHSHRPTQGNPIGSSPRVRGTLVQVLRRLAGFSVHPRVCGELSVVNVRVVCVAGSSPRVRGTQRSERSRSMCRRFIPACAGNSMGWRDLLPQRTVHPRVCGELDRDRQGNADIVGSSPRVRGTRPG